MVQFIEYSANETIFIIAMSVLESLLFFFFPWKSDWNTTDFFFFLP